MMNNKIAAITLAGLLAACPYLVLAADGSAEESTTPPTAIPGINQGGMSESNEEKASKKGEEASGSNSGAESHETDKDAATSSDSNDLKKAKP